MPAQRPSRSLQSSILRPMLQTPRQQRPCPREGANTKIRWQKTPPLEGDGLWGCSGKVGLPARFMNLGSSLLHRTIIGSDNLYYVFNSNRISARLASRATKNCHASKRSDFPWARRRICRRASGIYRSSSTRCGTVSPSSRMSPHLRLRCMGNCICMGLILQFLLNPLPTYAPS